MKILSLLFVFCFCVLHLKAQDDIVLNLDSIKNIKTTRYSSINEVGVAINVAGTTIEKFAGNAKKTTLSVDKPSFMFRTVHGALLNPRFFIGGGTGIDFRPNSTNGTNFYYFTFPFFVETREYILNGNFNMFFSERVGAAIYVDSYYNKYVNKGTSSGAFGEFMIGGRYVTNGKKFSIHFGAGYRLQHLQRKEDIQNIGVNTGPSYANTPVITLKHYVPITIGVTF